MASMQQGGPAQQGNQYGGPGGGMGGSRPAAGWGGVVADETLCTKCGYALRGLPLDGACPECNTPVQETLSKRRLHMADGNWLATVASGLRSSWILLAVIAAYSLIVGVLNAVLSQGGRSNSAMLVLLSLGVVIPTALRLWAWWQITTPDPTPNAPRDSEPLRVWNRRLIVIEAVIQSISLVLNLALILGGFYERFDAFNQAWAASKYAKMPDLGDAFTPADIVLYGLSTLMGLGGSAVLLAAFFCGIIYLRQLAMRAGDTETVKFAKVTMIAAPLCAVLLSCLFGLGIVIAFVLWLIVLIKCERMIRKCLEWQAEWLPRTL